MIAKPLQTTKAPALVEAFKKSSADPAIYEIKRLSEQQGRSKWT